MPCRECEARSACVDRGRTEASAPTDGLQEVCGAGDREGRPYGRVQEVPALSAGGVEPRPYGCVARSACAIGGRTEASAPTDALQGVPAAGRCGERTERCRWQIQRGERVAAVKISSVRRKAARKFWAPQQDHRPLRTVTRSALQDGAAGHMGPALQAQILYLFMCKTNKKYRSL